MFIVKAFAFIFLLIIFLVFVGVLRLMFFAKSHFTRFGNAFDQREQDAGRDSQRDGDKVFDSDAGEYVEFEDLPGESPKEDDGDDRKTAADYRAMITGDEGQVSDADYEEIK